MSAGASWRASCPRRRARVLAALEQGGRTTYAALAERLGEPLVAVHTAARELAAEGRVAGQGDEVWAVATSTAAGGSPRAVAEGGSQEQQGQQLALFGGRQ